MFGWSTFIIVLSTLTEAPTRAAKHTVSTVVSRPGEGDRIKWSLVPEATEPASPKNSEKYDNTHSLRGV